MKFEIVLTVDVPVDDLHVAKCYVNDLLFDPARANLLDVIKVVQDKTGGHSFGLKSKLSELEKLANGAQVKRKTIEE